MIADSRRANARGGEGLKSVFGADKQRIFFCQVRHLVKLYYTVASEERMLLILMGICVIQHPTGASEEFVETTLCSWMVDQTVKEHPAHIKIQGNFS